mmetsp:Transcript_8649/g.23485  ORF Transcript_8649/g.23485 Transcript_8649/m.23485 type:complete len:254 (+) Transcript_8649:760-1521(+)
MSSCSTCGWCTAWTITDARSTDLRRITPGGITTSVWFDRVKLPRWEGVARTEIPTSARAMQRAPSFPWTRRTSKNSLSRQRMVQMPARLHKMPMPRRLTTSLTPLRRRWRRSLTSSRTRIKFASDGCDVPRRTHLPNRLSKTNRWRRRLRSSSRARSCSMPNKSGATSCLQSCLSRRISSSSTSGTSMVTFWTRSESESPSASTVTITSRARNKSRSESRPVAVADVGVAEDAEDAAVDLAVGVAHTAHLVVR